MGRFATRAGLCAGFGWGCEPDGSRGRISRVRVVNGHHFHAYLLLGLFRRGHEPSDWIYPARSSIRASTTRRNVGASRVLVSQTISGASLFNG